MCDSTYYLVAVDPDLPEAEEAFEDHLDSIARAYALNP